MILPDLILPSRVNQRWQYSGIDSPELCVNKKHFREYPYPVDYQYNSRGFRDAEWPASPQELQEAIWCVGDSFTVGVGQPFGHIWPQILSRHLKTRSINVSMDGASNDWICRRAEQIHTEIQPRFVIVMWSYLHRREYADANLDDEQRRLWSTPASREHDYWNWMKSVAKLRGCNDNIIQSTIPDFASVATQLKIADQIARLDTLKKIWQDVKDPTWPRFPETLEEFDSLPEYILNELRDLHQVYRRMRSIFLPWYMETPLTESIDISNIIRVAKRLDWARDHHHFDILTSEWFVDQILQRMKSLDFSRKHLLSGSEHQSVRVC